MRRGVWSRPGPAQKPIEQNTSGSAPGQYPVVRRHAPTGRYLVPVQSADGRIGMCREFTDTYDPVGNSTIPTMSWERGVLVRKSQPMLSSHNLGPIVHPDDPATWNS